MNKEQIDKLRSFNDSTTEVWERLLAVTRSPNVIDQLDKTLQDDELLIKLSKS